MKAGPELSYAAARKEYDDRYYQLTKLANNWRVTALGSIAASIILAGGMIAVSMQQKAVPYVVELNGNSEVVRVARADAVARPNNNQIRAALRTWIIGARMVYGDPVAQRKDLDATYAMTLPNSPAYQALVEYHEHNNPFERFKKETVEVAVNVVVRKTDNTWQLEWTETKRDATGKVISTTAWQGSATVKIIPPTTDSQVLVNGLGVYVSGFDWNARI